MADFQTILLPDGTPLQFPSGMSDADMAAAIQSNFPEFSSTNIAEQAGSGINEGLAGLVGSPVDLLTAGLNLGATGIEKLTGSKLGRIENAIGGSESINNLLKSAGMITEAEPATTAQRFTRRIGKEVGANILPALGLMGKTASAAKPVVGLLDELAMSAQAAPKTFLAGETAASVGAGVSGQAAEEAGLGQTGQTIASLLGGVSAARFATPKPQMVAGSRAVNSKELKNEGADLLASIDKKGVVIPQTITSSLKDDALSAFEMEGITLPNGKLGEGNEQAKNVLSTLEQFSVGQMTGAQLKSYRKRLSNMMDSKDSAESRLGGILTGQLENKVSDLAPELAAGFQTYRQAYRVKEVEKAVDAAKGKAGTFSGSGFENALRSEFKNLLLKNIRGTSSVKFTDAEIAMINKIANGQLGLRDLGKASPSGLISASMSTSVPFLIASSIFGSGAGVAAAVATPMIGYAARQAATRGQVNSVEELQRSLGVRAQTPSQTLGPRAPIMGIQGLTAAQQALFGR